MDEAGNRADIVKDPTSIIARMNVGSVYEQYVSAACRDVSKKVRSILNLEEGKVTIDALMSTPPSTIGAAFDHLLGFYKITSPVQYNHYARLTRQDILKALVQQANHITRLYYPANNEYTSMTIVQNIEASGIYAPTYGPVSYVGNSGKRSQTKEFVRIGPMNIMALDKITDDWSAISLARLQHFGILSPVTKAEKFSTPHRNTATKTVSEADGRIFICYTGEYSLAESMDRSNNPTVQREIARSIMTADKPTNIDNVVDREKIPLGSNKPLQLVKHIFACSGFTTEYSPEKDQ